MLSLLCCSFRQLENLDTWEGSVTALLIVIVIVIVIVIDDIQHNDISNNRPGTSWQAASLPSSSSSLELSLVCLSSRELGEKGGIL